MFSAWLFSCYNVFCNLDLFCYYLFDGINQYTHSESGFFPFSPVSRPKLPEHICCWQTMGQVKQTQLKGPSCFAAATAAKSICSSLTITCHLTLCRWHPSCYVTIQKRSVYTELNRWHFISTVESTPSPPAVK